MVGRRGRFIMGYIFHTQLTKNKSFEIQMNIIDDMSRDTIFELNFDWRIRYDHAGPRFTFALYRVIYIHVMVYDHRHWDYEQGKWEEGTAVFSDSE